MYNPGGKYVEVLIALVFSLKLKFLQVSLV